MKLTKTEQSGYEAAKKIYESGKVRLDQLLDRFVEAEKRTTGKQLQAFENKIKGKQLQAEQTEEAKKILAEYSNLLQKWSTSMRDGVSLFVFEQIRIEEEEGKQP